MMHKRTGFTSAMVLIGGLGLGLAAMSGCEPADPPPPAPPQPQPQGEVPNQSDMPRPPSRPDTESSELPQPPPGSP